MNIPTTPIPCSSTGQQTNSNNGNTMTTTSTNKTFAQSSLSSSSSSQAIQSLYTNTFSLIGNEFMDCVVRELAHWTHSQAVMVLQLMTREEYRDMTNDTQHEEHSRERSPTQTTFTVDGSLPSLSNSDSTGTTATSSTTLHDNSNDKYLIVRFSYCSMQQQQPENLTRHFPKLCAIHSAVSQREVSLVFRLIRRATALSAYVWMTIPVTGVVVVAACNTRKRLEYYA
ncbi:hypothetical protein BDB00DRAFT_443506 [Zychaea mexicana]|uniref:uncharacterized protein n=1 Tax=Zychaea mexicana TaxID=64656 RepID=UPI0022FE2444|nr:uncharacterized protein BDB00DRAFT_443506 [Zychaea mexicana]KAI9498328.1 hypothetical protein BDB00DRAFT_443506 [Zychaea mexicana]